MLEMTSAPQEVGLAIGNQPSTPARVSAESFRLASCQATLFTPDEEMSAAKLLGSLVPRWLARFDADPLLLPPAEGLPREVPRFILNSSSGSWRCEIAPARVNLFWRRTETVSPALTPALTQFFGDDATLLLNEYVDFLKARVGRLAAVLNRYASHASPGLFLARHFCQERWMKAPLNRPENFELHAHKRFRMGEFHVNSWVRSKTGRVSIEGASEPIVLVEQDINTLQEETEIRSFNSDEVTRFFAAVSSEFDVILPLYYPSVA